MKKLFALTSAMILLISGFVSAETSLVESEETMANIPQVNVGGIVYNLKDTEAREQISDLNTALNYIRVSNRTTVKDLYSLETIELVDKASIIGGYYVVWANGSIAQNASFCVTDYIPVLPSTTLFITGAASGAQYALYNASLEYISGAASHGATQIVIPDNENVCYIRYATVIENKNELRLFYNSTLNNKIESRLGSLYDVLFKNQLLDVTTMVDGEYVDYNTGVFRPLASFSRTDYIRVLSGSQIAVAGGASGSQVAYYDKNKAYISGAITNENSFIIPNDSRIEYMVWCTELEKKASASLIIAIEKDSTIYIDSTKGILEGVIEAYSKGARKIVVYSGEYDILEEYENHFGSDCWDNYVETGYNSALMGIYGRGIWIDNLEIVFMPGAKVVAHYTGNNAAVKKMFSPFAVGSDATIIGLVIDSSELRYCVHPDFHPRTYETIVFKDCDFHHLKGADNNEAVGCGFGAHSYWTFENCIFRSDGNNRVFRIHNADAENVQSKAVVKNCYVVGNGYMTFNCHGQSTLVSTVEVYGCSWLNPARIGYEYGAQIENMQLLAWNNETRQQ